MRTLCACFGVAVMLFLLAAVFVVREERDSAYARGYADGYATATRTSRINNFSAGIAAGMEQGFMAGVSGVGCVDLNRPWD